MVSGGRFANTDKSRLFAEFFSNIAVAWFAGGVIGVFIGNVRTPREIVFFSLLGNIVQFDVSFGRREDFRKV